MNLNTIKPLTIILNLENSNLTHQEKVKIKHDYILEQLKLNKRYVGWDYVSIYAHKSNNKYRGLIVKKDLLISTNGNVRYMVGNKYTLTVGAKVALYRRFDRTFMDNGESNNKFNFYIHRALASTFIPLNKEEDPSELVTNHIDDNGEHNSVTNLEWCTHKENVKHAVDTGLLTHEKGRYVLGTIGIDGKYQGEQFILSGSNQIKEYGFDCDSIWKACRGKIEHTHGCYWEYITADRAKYFKPPTKRQIDYLLNDVVKKSLKIKPIVAEVLKDGPFKGYKFSIYGVSHLLGCGLHQTRIHKVINNKSPSYINCKWKFTNYSEAEKYPTGLSPLMREYLTPRTNKEREEEILLELIKVKE
ncbi:MAG: hypothetical protein ACRCTA_04225 [Bacilli bacterium]